MPQCIPSQTVPSRNYRLTCGGCEEPALDPGCWDDAGIRFTAVAIFAARAGVALSPARGGGYRGAPAGTVSFGSR